MQITSRTNFGYWATAAVGVGIGVIYLAGFAAGGKPLLGLGALGIMVAFTGALILAAGAARPSAACSTTATSGFPPSTCGPPRSPRWP